MININRMTLKLTLLTLALSLLVGCGGKGKLSLTGVGEKIKITGKFTTAIFGVDDEQRMHVLLVEGPVDQPTQFVHLQMFWIPQAGKTPMDASATNATVRYVINNEEGVIVYGGAGFLLPGFGTSQNSLNADLRNANLRVLDISKELDQPIQLMLAQGWVKAKRDDAQTRVLLNQLRTLISEKLGYPRFVLQ